MKPMKSIIITGDENFKNKIAKELSQHGAITSLGYNTDLTKMANLKKYHSAFIHIENKSDLKKSLQNTKHLSSMGLNVIVISKLHNKGMIEKHYLSGCHSFFDYEKFNLELSSHINIIIKRYNHQNLDKYIANNFITSDSDLIEKIKDTATWSRHNVMITGPTGVGKSKMAKLIHDLDDSTKPFVHLNLSELPENLIESELFGYQKGAFTGATQSRPGLLEQADGGTLFLDEIGTVSPYLQKKLLKVIEDKSFTPVGSNKLKVTSFKLITATCDDIESLIRKGEFRLDFYFRIKGLDINISPLSSRTTDILLLMEHFITRESRKITISKEAEKILITYMWPGNVRELENLIMELINGPKGYISLNDLPKHILENSNPLEPKALEKQKFLGGNMKEYIYDKGLNALVTKIQIEATDSAVSDSKGKVGMAYDKLKISRAAYYRIRKIKQMQDDKRSRMADYSTI